MAKGMTLNAVLKLTKTQFDKGIREVQKTLNSLKSTFLQVAGALGAGLGLGKILSEVKDTAVQLSVAQATLENVSQNLVENAHSWEYLKRISNDYGQDLVSLTQGFAKFRAAAGLAGVSLTEIQRIYEALTRASGAFHLSADQTNLVMTAVEQMFSKGKVTAEELRRQLGNSLPGAFGYMAEAAGRAGVTANGTTGELEAMMKAGKVLAKDVMPEFANVLNEVTEHANFDSLQSSLNRLGNAWTQFVQKTGFEGFFKGIVDSGTGALESIGVHFQGLKQLVISTLAAIGGAKAWKALQDYGERALKKLNQEGQRLLNANKSLSREITAINTELTKLGSGNPLDKVTMSLSSAQAAAAGLDQTVIETLTVLEMDGKKAHEITLLNIEAQNVLNARLKEAQKQYDANNAAMLKMGADGLRATNTLKKAWLGVKTAARAAGTAIKAALSSFIIGAIIGLVTELIQKIVELAKESKELNKSWEEYKNEATEVDAMTMRNIAEVKSLARQLDNVNRTESERKGIIDALNEKMKLSGDKMLTIESTAKDINTAIEGWSEGIINAAKRMGLMNKIGELSSENISLAADNDYRRKHMPKIGAGFASGRISRNEARIKHNEQIISALEQELDRMGGEITKEIYGGKEGSNDNGKGFSNTKEKVDALQKAIDDYNEKLKQLKNQLSNGAITSEEFANQAGELAESTWKNIAGFDQWEQKLISFGGTYKQVGDLIRSRAEDYSIASSIEKDIDESQKALDKAIDESIKKYESAQEKFREILATGVPGKGGDRDGFFDYKTKKSGILGDIAKGGEDRAKEIESIVKSLMDLKSEAGSGWDGAMQSYLDKMVEKLREAKNEAKSLRDAANIAELEEDIKKLKTQFNSISYDGFNKFAESTERAAKGFISLHDAFKKFEEENDKHPEENFYNSLELLISAFNELIQTIDMVNGAIEMYNKIKEASTALEKAQQAQTLATAGAQVLGSEMQAAAEVKSATQTVAAEGTKQVAIHSTTGALVGQAAAGAAASQASIPYIGPALAIAAATAVVGLLTALASKKFANGGIVGGSSYSGDKQIARVNSGEMILNKHQQGVLWGMLNGKGGMHGNSQVEFKIRGTDLIGAINNTTAKRRG